MKLIQLPHGVTTMVDDCDFESLILTKWHVGNGYVMRTVHVPYKPHLNIKMHRQILGLEKGDGLVVDHIDGNKLNNQRSNLRICSMKENARNSRKRKTTASGYKGAYWHALAKKWRAMIKHNGKYVHLGFFDTPELANAAYCAAAVKFYGEFANFGDRCAILDKE
jgi:hypothetical protein